MKRRSSGVYEYTQKNGGGLGKFRVANLKHGWAATVYSWIDARWITVTYPHGERVRTRTRKEMKEYLEYAFGVEL